MVLPYRNPFVVAKSGATLDLLSGGRFTLAIGVGYLKREFAALGVDFDERNELFDEALEVIRAIWTTDDVSFEGRHFTARGITAHPRPISQPHPPIWIGGNTGGPASASPTHGDGWCPFPAPAVLARPRARRRWTRSSAWLTASRTCADGSTTRAATGRRSTSRSPISRAAVPGADDFNADAYLTGLDELAAIWASPGCRWRYRATAWRTRSRPSTVSASS